MLSKNELAIIVHEQLDRIFPFLLCFYVIAFVLAKFMPEIAAFVYWPALHVLMAAFVVIELQRHRETIRRTGTARFFASVARSRYSRLPIVSILATIALLLAAKFYGAPMHAYAAIAFGVAVLFFRVISLRTACIATALVLFAIPVSEALGNETHYVVSSVLFFECFIICLAAAVLDFIHNRTMVVPSKK